MRIIIVRTKSGIRKINDYVKDIIQHSGLVIIIANLQKIYYNVFKYAFLKFRLKHNVWLLLVVPCTYKDYKTRISAKHINGQRKNLPPTLNISESLFELTNMYDATT